MSAPDLASANAIPCPIEGAGYDCIFPREIKQVLHDASFWLDLKWLVDDSICYQLSPL